MFPLPQRSSHLCCFTWLPPFPAHPVVLVGAVHYSKTQEDQFLSNLTVPQDKARVFIEIQKYPALNKVEITMSDI